jgi:hypothetical protein
MDEKLPKRKNLAIVGKAPASILRTPFDDESYEIWSLSDNYRQLKRWDRWFEIHDVEFHRQLHPEHWEFLTTNHGKPLYLLEPHRDIPHALAFPKAAIFERFPQPEFHRYFTNSISWFIAMALVEGFEHIGLYGVDMAQHEEYAQQRPSCEYWIGVANGLGVTVEIPEESDLMKSSKLYGYETHNGQMYLKCRARDMELGERIRLCEQQKSEAAQNKNMYFGGLQEIKRVLSTGLNGEVGNMLASRCMELEQKVAAFSQIEETNQAQIYVLSGAKENVQWARQWCQ